MITHNFGSKERNLNKLPRGEKKLVPEGEIQRDTKLKRENIQDNL